MSSGPRIRLISPLNYPIHLPSVREEEVPAVLGLKDRVVVPESGPVLIGDVHREAQHRRVDSTLRDLNQAHCRVRGRTQGFCDKVQAPGVGASAKLRKAVVLLRELDPLPSCPNSDPFVAVQDDQRV